jgi:hypothetical protein
VKKTTIFILLCTALLHLTSCFKGPDADDPNVIVDPEGVLLELVWNNNATDPTADTYLSLSVNDGSKDVLESSGWFDFGEIDISNGAINNGTYNLNVYIFAIDRSTNYTLKMTGNSTGKTFSRSYGPINANDKYLTLYPTTMTVTGTTYVMN